jgi:hypothetical protein
MGRPKNSCREEVPEKAMPVFWAHGFSDTTLQDLERATGVDKSGLCTEFRFPNWESQASVTLRLWRACNCSQVVSSF